MRQLIEQVKHISSGQYPETNKRSLLSGELLEISKLEDLSDHRDLLQQASRVVALSKYTLGVKKQISQIIIDLYPILRYYFGGTSIKLEMIISGKMCERRDLVLSNYLKEGLKISYSSYYNQHILYAFLTDIDEEIDVVKFGYTFDLASRPTSLHVEYKSMFYLIGAKVIAAEKDEKLFHKILKGKYARLVYDLKVNKTNKKELYHFEPVLMEEFEMFNPSALPEKYWDLLKEQEKTTQIKEKTVQVKIKCESAVIVEQERSKQCETNLLIKQTDLLLTDRQIEYTKLQIELAKLQRRD